MTGFYPDDVPPEVAKLVGRQSVQIEEQRQRIDRLRDILRRALARYGTAEGRVLLRDALADGREGQP